MPADLIHFLARVSIWAIPMVLAFTVHEAMHGFVARRYGDDTAERLGRLTLNPLKHIDPIGTIVMPSLALLLNIPVIGWAKPVPVNPAKLRNPRVDMAKVAAAGPLSNLVQAFLWALLLAALQRISGTGGGPSFADVGCARPESWSTPCLRCSTCCRYHRSTAAASCAASFPPASQVCSTVSSPSASSSCSALVRGCAQPAAHAAPRCGVAPGDDARRRRHGLKERIWQSHRATSASSQACGRQGDCTLAIITARCATGSNCSISTSAISLSPTGMRSLRVTRIPRRSRKMFVRWSSTGWGQV